MSNFRLPTVLGSSGRIPLGGPPEEQSRLLAIPYEAYRPHPQPHTSYQLSPEASPQFTPPAAWGVPGRAPSPQLAPSATWSLQPDTSSAHFLRSDTASVGIPTSPRRKRLHLILGSAFPAIAAIVELLMLVYFLDVYLSLPITESGSRKRISPVYSIWPYISCVGSTVETAFRIFSFLYLFFFVGTFVCDLWLNYDAPRGYIFRWLRLIASIIAAGLLVALVFASVDDRTHLHLYLTSVRQISGFLVKTLSWIVDHLQRKHYAVMRRDQAMLISKRWKYTIFAGAVPAAILASVGIYACQNQTPINIQTQGTTCYYLVAMSSIADWTYGFLNVAFNLCLAFDLYHSEHFAKLRTHPQQAAKDKDSVRKEREQIRYSEV